MVIPIEVDLLMIVVYFTAIGALILASIPP